jgi:hypothetical protein
VRGAWRYLLLAWAVSLALALALGAIVRDAVRQSLGASLAAERMRASWDSLWYASFSTQASGVAATLRPSVGGAGAVLDALDALLDGFAGVLAGGAGTGVLPAMLVYLVAWTFLGGGLLATFARPSDREPFLGRATRVFPRMAMVSAAALSIYALVLGPIRSALDGQVAAALRDRIDERVAFAWTAGEYALLWAMLVAVQLVADYAKVYVVRADDRRVFVAPLAAIARAARLVIRQPRRTAGLFAATGLVWLTVLALYAWVAPGARVSSAGAILGAFALGQVYVLGRIAVRGLFLASETALCTALDAPRPQAWAGEAPARLEAVR